MQQVFPKGLITFFWFSSLLTKHKDLDIDDNMSHVEGSTTLISAGESESESDNDQIEPEVDIAETPYIQQDEFGDEFGAVS